MYSWGRGMFGRLGLGSEKDELFPVQVKFENPNGAPDTVKIVAIAAGAYHSLALSGSLNTSYYFIPFNLIFSPFQICICIYVFVILYRYPQVTLGVSGKWESNYGEGSEVKMKVFFFFLILKSHLTGQRQF